MNPNEQSIITKSSAEFFEIARENYVKVIDVGCFYRMNEAIIAGEVVLVFKSVKEEDVFYEFIVRCVEQPMLDENAFKLAKDKAHKCLTCFVNLLMEMGYTVGNTIRVFNMYRRGYFYKTMC